LTNRVAAIGNDAKRWPERLSPFIEAATVHIPHQQFDSAKQFNFAKQLKMNPWHRLPEHRLLSNQSRVRLRMYHELSRFRQMMNQSDHIEPTGNEIFS
jgi:hypothetical protein